MLPVTVASSIIQGNGGSYSHQDLYGRYALDYALRIGTPAGVDPANIYIDGRFAGKTPIPAFKVKPGRHTVKFKWADGREITKTIEVAEGGSKVVRAGL